MIGGSKPSGSTTTVQQSDPWAGQQPYLKDIFSQAQMGVGDFGSQGTTKLGGKNYVKVSGADYGSKLGSNIQGAIGGQRLGQFGMPVDNQNVYIPESVWNSMGDKKGVAAQGYQPATGFLQPNAYPGQTVADFSPETQQAMDLVKQRALAGSPVMDSASGLLQDNLQGKYLTPDSNPFMAGYLNNAMDSVRGQVNSSFGTGGGFGGSANQEVLARELGKTATNILAPAYDQERNRQMQSMLFAPQAAASDYADAGALAGVGGQKEGMNQAQINAEIEKFNIGNQAPYTALQRYAGLLGMGSGYGTTSQTNPYYSNQGAGALGGALGGGLMGASQGAGIAGMLGSQTPWLYGGPTGAMIGGGLGLLGGLL